MQNIFPLPVTLLIISILALLSFFLSASETSIIGLSKIRLRHMIARGIRRAHSIQRLVGKPDKFIAAILISNNFVNIAMSAIVTAIFVSTLGYRWGILVSTLISSVFVVILCEITPKILATKHTQRVALFTAPFMEALVVFLKPVIRIFIWVSNLILKVSGVEQGKRSPLITEEELRMLIDISTEEGILREEEKRMLQRIFEFGETKVNSVMAVKNNIVAVNINASPEELLNTFVEKGHARLPVYSGTIDSIVGVIYAQDLLYILRDKGLFVTQDLVREPYYVLGNMRVNELLKKFQAARLQIAIVVDSHKRTQGVVTLEDLTEEIVGEIDEAHLRHPLKKR